jgi:predicted deacetylase
MPVHISLHDVSPANQDAVDAVLADTARVGVLPALLVVPNHHGRFPLADHPRFIDRLRELQARGHEIYLHGYYHLVGVGERLNRGGSPTSHGLSWLWNQRVVSAGEAEFGDLSRLEAQERIQQGLRELHELGLRVDGFVPPAWSMPRWLLPILADHGIRYTENHLRVIDPVTGSRRATLLLNFATRSKSRMLATVLFCRAASPLATYEPTRFAIHPGDYRTALVRRQIQALLPRLARDQVARGSALLEGWHSMEEGGAVASGTGVT